MSAERPERSTYRFRLWPRYRCLVTRTAVGTGDSDDEGSSLDLLEFGRRKYEEDRHGVTFFARPGGSRVMRWHQSRPPYPIPARYRSDSAAERTATGADSRSGTWTAHISCASGVVGRTINSPSEAKPPSLTGWFLARSIHGRRRRASAPSVCLGSLRRFRCRRPTRRPSRSFRTRSAPNPLPLRSPRPAGR
jgi:hypothetical protein